MLALLGAGFLGWSLGANDASNVFGSAVSSRMLRFRSAAVLAAVFVVLGAVLQGRAGIETLKGLTGMNLSQAIVSSWAAAVTVTVMTLLRLPVSTSQAVVGAIVGVGLMNRHMNLSGLGKVTACWFGTPLGGMIAAVIVFKVLGALYNRLEIDLFQSDAFLRGALVVAGSYGAYALGANNVANVTAVFVGAGYLSAFSATLIGGVSIALGILTFSRGVMETMGRKLIKLDPFSALVVVLAEAICVHLYTVIGVPVSTSQAVVGAIIGVGLVKGITTVSRRTLGHIFAAWFVTPVLGGLIAAVLHIAMHLRYVPAG
ncbi:MAG: anion permease [Deltaproteobacteria bacterium]|nr:anion permease [Deltaproteobacteria bacterium]